METMVNVNYGRQVSEDTESQICDLFKGDNNSFPSGISEDIIHEILDQAGEKVLHIATGNNISEVSLTLPDNQNELIDMAVVLIKVNSDYQFLVPELATLIKYFDSYPLDPKITWRYNVDSKQDEPVAIIIFKSLINKQL